MISFIIASKSMIITLKSLKSYENHHFGGPKSSFWRYDRIERVEMTTFTFRVQKVTFWTPLKKNTKSTLSLGNPYCPKTQKVAVLTVLG